MNMVFLVVLGMALFYITGTSAQREFYPCSYITGSDINCMSFHQEDICGTDKVTYTSKCTFSQAHCKDLNLHLLHTGACNTIDFQTTPLPSHGAEVVLDFFCTSLSHISCGTTIEKVCGSDGRTYINMCEFEKSKCTHRDLHVANFGDCTA